MSSAVYCANQALCTVPTKSAVYCVNQERCLLCQPSALYCANQALRTVPTKRCLLCQTNATYCAKQTLYTVQNQALSTVLTKRCVLCQTSAIFVGFSGMADHKHTSKQKERVRYLNQFVSSLTNNLQKGTFVIVITIRLNTKNTASPSNQRDFAYYDLSAKSRLHSSRKKIPYDTLYMKTYVQSRTGL